MLSREQKLDRRFDRLINAKSVLKGVGDVLTGGAFSAKEGAKAGRRDIQRARDIASGQLLTGAEATRGILAGLPATTEPLVRGATARAGEAFAGGFGRAGEELRGGATRAGEALRAGTQQAISPLQPFQETGLAAQQNAAALSGALGPEAQQQALAGFQFSPGQQFLQEQAQRATLQSAAATGGLGGGNVRRELERQRIGLSSQALQQQIQNQLAIGQTGFGAAQGISGLQGQQGVNLANIETGVGTGLANLQTGLAGQQAGIGLGEAQELIRQRENLARQQIAAEQQLGAGLANIQTGTATNIAEARILEGALRGQVGSEFGKSLAKLFAPTA